MSETEGHKRSPRKQPEDGAKREEAGPTQDGESLLQVTKDKLAVLLTCTVDPSDLETLEWRIRRELVSLGVDSKWQHENLAEWLAAMAERNPRLEKEVLERGTPPIPGVDGRIEWGGDFFKSGFIMDESTGAIDYRKHAAQRTVRNGQFLARLIAPREGADGTDVFGKAIATPKPCLPRVATGVNVREDGDCFYATADGRIRWEPKDRDSDKLGGRLSVDEVYTVHGSVNLETGNISHPGALVVDKDIEEGATVETDGDIDVRGLVEPCDITSRGNLTVRGGITGAGGKHICVKGSVHARFILDADIEAEGDVVVEREIRHSTVKTRSAVVVPRGHVTGGTLTALGGITAGYVGSYSVATTVVAGEDFLLTRQLQQREEEIARQEEALNRIQAVLKPLIPQFQTISADRQKALAGLLAVVKQSEESIEGLRREMAALKEASRARAVCRINILYCIYPETILRLGREWLQVRTEFPGPAAATLYNGNVELRPSKG